MGRYSARLLLTALLLGGCTAGHPAQAANCDSLLNLADRPVDASSALADCIRKLPPGGRLDVGPGIYRIEQPLRIDKPVTIATAGLGRNSPGCGSGRVACAILRLDLGSASRAKRVMPIEVTADDVMLSHLVVDASGMSAARRRFCADPALRPLGGALRVSGSRFTLRASAVRGAACYTAIEIVKGAIAPSVLANVIGPNGDHRPGGNWSDGVTIHDTSEARVSGNLFIDNSDVQLILGGCRQCRIEDNRFRHSGSFRGGAFAELMIHAWPTTSGDYSATLVDGNDVDCGPRRRCGFGIMIGSSPWYDRPVRGPKVVGNRVANAMIGLDIDALDGPAEIHDNIVTGSGGSFRSDCGLRSWPAVNVAPGSRSFIRGDPSNLKEGSVATAHCLLNRDDR